MATLPDIKISYSSRKTMKFNRKRIEFGDGYSERFVKGINTARMSWSVTWKVNGTDRDTLIAFLDATEGTDSFDWQPPGESSSYKWSIDGYDEEPTQYDTYTITATFVQEFDT